MRQLSHPGEPKPPGKTFGDTDAFNRKRTGVKRLLFTRRRTASPVAAGITLRTSAKSVGST